MEYRANKLEGARLEFALGLTQFEPTAVRLPIELLLFGAEVADKTANYLARGKPLAVRRSRQCLSLPTRQEQGQFHNLFVA
jgi:hypothetical protein